ncbi:MAG: hypothetical protein PHT80_04250 [Lentisphaeria bacterium]|nr:hypothetical protein [Lentisphaeria bacterium]
MQIRALVGIGAALCLAAHGADSVVTRDVADVDGDGVPEVVLSNEFLRVEIMTGEPAPPVEPALDAEGNPIKVVYKYGNRFNWGGWIYNISYLPSGRSWLASVNDKNQNWYGIPEEFEETVPMAELEPGRYVFMLPGIGIGEGTGRGFRGSLKEVQHAPWTIVEEWRNREDDAWQTLAEDDREGPRSATGAWRLTFTQTIATDYGYACEYRKEMTLYAGESRLHTRRTLRNTGEKIFQTTWFTHGFWGQGADKGYDQDSWSSIPVIPPAAAGLGPLRVDSEASDVVSMIPGYHWGAISIDQIGETWHALGNRATGDVFMNSFDGKLAWWRVWTDAKTYSCEPFMIINLFPGQTREWRSWRGAGQGLTGVKGEGPGGMVDWTLTVPAPDGEAQLEIAFLPYRVWQDLSLSLTIEDLANRERRQQQFQGRAAAPGEPLRVQFGPVQAGRDYRLQVQVHNGDELLLDVSREEILRDKPRTAWDGDAKGAGALIFAHLRRDDAGELKPTRVSQFWQHGLQAAGFAPSVHDVNDALDDALWQNARLVVIAASRISPANLRQVEKIVQAGAGLVVQGTIDFRAFELSDILPISLVQGELNLRASSPRDGTRAFTTVNDRLYHLVAADDAAQAHPVLAGLPLYPESYQGIGQLQLVEPCMDAQVLLSYAGGAQVVAPLSSPALVVRSYGAGRVAYFASPIDWGAATPWSIWSRLGEYHRKFMAQLALWAADCP